MKSIISAFCLCLVCVSNAVFASSSEHENIHQPVQSQIQNQSQFQGQRTDVTVNPNANASAVANPTATSNATSSPTTTSSAISTSASGVTVDAGAITNSPTNSVSTGSITTTVTNQGVSLVGGSQTVTVDAPIIPPPAAYIPSAAGSVPQLFGTPDTTVNEKGINLTLYYSQICPSRAIRGYDQVTRSYKGASGNTTITFTPHLNYAKAIKKPADPWNDLPADKNKEVQEVTSEFGKSGHYICLGIVTISAMDKNASDVTLATILSDATLFPIKEMEGFERISLAAPHDPYEVIANTKGVDNNGRGYGVGVGLSKLFSSPVLGTLGGSASSNSGVTYPESKIGATFLVLVEDPNGVFIDFSEKKPVPVAEVKPAPVVPVVEVPKAEKPKPAPVVKPKPVKKAVKAKPAPKAVVPNVIQCNKCTLDGTITMPPPAPKKPSLGSSGSVSAPLPAAKPESIAPVATEDKNRWNAMFQKVFALLT